VDYNRNKNIAYIFFLFLISPFLSLIVALKYVKVKVIENIIWAYFTFLGFILVKSNPGTDVYRYSDWFESFAVMQYAEKLKFFEDDKLDFFRSFSFHFISFFSSSSRVYFAFIGLVYGFFYSRIIGMILMNISKRISFLDKLFVISFLFILPFTSVQFVRFSTAIVVFLYFTLKYFLDGNDKKYLVLACIGSVFVHFSFAFPSALLLLFVFLPKKFDIYLYAYVISSIFMIVEFSALKTLIEAYLPSSLESKESYLNEDYADRVSTSLIQTNWYIQYKGLIVKFTTLFLLFYTRSLIKKGSLQLNKYKNILLFGLFLGTAANIVSVVPSGNRFLGVSYPIIWLVLTVIHVTNKKYQGTLFNRVLLYSFFSFQIIVGFRFAVDVLPIEFFTSNPVLIFFGLSDIPIIDFIK
jgi:hypothetical protein